MDVASTIGQGLYDVIYAPVFALGYTPQDLSNDPFVASPEVLTNAVEHPVNTALQAATGISTGMIVILAIGGYFLLKK